MERADLLARCSDEPGQITRLFGTPAHASAIGTVSGWMKAAGMTVRRDAIGNLIGRFEGDEPDARVLLLGSHLDTVRDAGRGFNADSASHDGGLGLTSMRERLKLVAGELSIEVARKPGDRAVRQRRSLAEQQACREQHRSSDQHRAAVQQKRIRAFSKAAQHDRRDGPAQRRADHRQHRNPIRSVEPELIAKHDQQAAQTEGGPRRVPDAETLRGQQRRADQGRDRNP